tara:strand:- start:1443 stop:1670 length:228 start_codon:yes stop_codon:yes gene_type:complete
MKHLKVDGYSHLYRDPKTNSIINKNSSQYDEYMSKKTLKEEENQKLQNLEADVANMKSDLSEIKTLLRSLANDGS